MTDQREKTIGEMDSKELQEHIDAKEEQYRLEKKTLKALQKAKAAEEKRK